MEKILGFESAEATQMALKFLGFFRNIFKYIQDFSCSSKQFLGTFFFIQGFFNESRKIKKGSAHVVFVDLV